MALKKLPRNLSYEAIRHKHPPTPNHARGTAPVEDVKAEEATTPTITIEDDRMIAAPDDPASVPGTPTEATQHRARVEGPRRNSKPARRSTGPNTDTPANKSVRVRGYVRIPQAGEHRGFDELLEIYGERDALSLALSTGMASYEAALRQSKVLVPPSRPHRRSGRVETSRSMPQELYAKAVEHLDPKGMLGRSQIGSRILDLALAHYLKKSLTK
ncbi:hypothetical protein [uncultured Jannaschia sp.]|uniref:hypothetical protein n=1 Tax=uncultured Jannaschia sp. TaxID=293347 RepID=UPI00261CE727|nr:hypothetical protein [uncultured Jannaschia sp.]